METRSETPTPSSGVDTGKKEESKWQPQLFVDPVNSDDENDINRNQNIKQALTGDSDDEDSESECTDPSPYFKDKRTAFHSIMHCISRSIRAMTSQGRGKIDDLFIKPISLINTQDWDKNLPSFSAMDDWQKLGTVMTILQQKIEVNYNALKQCTAISDDTTFLSACQHARCIARYMESTASFISLLFAHDPRNRDYFGNREEKDEVLKGYYLLNDTYDYFNTIQNMLLFTKAKLKKYIEGKLEDQQVDQNRDRYPDPVNSP